MKLTRVDEDEGMNEMKRKSPLRCRADTENDVIDVYFQLWSSYFDLAVAYLTQPSLQLEKCSENQRKNMLRYHGDMRVRMGFQILSMWNAIGDYKIHFIPSMVGPFLQVTLVREPQLRKATLPMFFDMLDCEYRHRGNFKQVTCPSCSVIHSVLNHQSNRIG